MKNEKLGKGTGVGRSLFWGLSVEGFEGVERGWGRGSAVAIMTNFCNIIIPHTIPDFNPTTINQLNPWEFSGWGVKVP